MKIAKYLFIGGSQRTGTTMLQALLCQHEKTNEMLGEASYLRGLVQAYQNGCLLFTKETKDYFENIDAFQHFHSKIISQFLDLQMEQRNETECLVLKEPHLTNIFPFLFQLIPEAKFLLIMRDPRDAIGSMIRVGEKLRQRGEQHFFQQRNMVQLSQYFQSFYQPVLSDKNTKFKNQTSIIRYEDLVTGQKHVFDTIEQFSGIELTQGSNGGDLKLGKFNSLVSSENYQPWATKKLGRTPDATSVGRYKSILSTVEIQQIEQSCSQIMHHFSYN